MHVAVDAIGIKHSGGAVVLLDFLNAAINDSRISRITVFCSPRVTRNFVLPDSQKIQEQEIAQAETSYAYRILWFEYLLAKACQKIGADVLICMTGSGHSGRAIPQVTFIQQSLPFCAECKPLMKIEERVRFTVMKELMRRSCKKAERVIVQTPTMKTWVAKQLRLSLVRVEVIIPNAELLPLPAEPTLFSPTSQPNDGPRLLYVGSNSPHKNLPTIIQGVQQLRKEEPTASLYLTVPEALFGSQMPGIVGLGYLSRLQLAEAYRQMDILVMPSLVETVGLPMMEAMSVGIPVLAADRPYAHDMCEDAAIYFDPRSSDDFAQRAKQLLQDQKLRKTLIQKGFELLALRKNNTPYAKMVQLTLDSAKQLPIFS